MEKKLSSISENMRRNFTANVSHELKTPIFNIQGYISTLLDGGLEDELIKEMSVKQGLTEELKAKDMMKWVQLMNNLRHEVQEIVTQQIIMSV